MEEHAVMTTVDRTLEALAFGIDIVGVGILLIGVAVGLTGFVAALIKHRGGSDRYWFLQRARCRLGTYLLFGLELMIVSDVIHSVGSRSLEDLAALGALVVIRTVIAHFLGREIEEIQAGIRAQTS